jgi:hypothetical protein
MSSNRTAPRSRRKPDRRNTAEAVRSRVRDQEHEPEITDGAAAAERASAGMGTQDAEPTDWLFGDTLARAASRPY